MASVTPVMYVLLTCAISLSYIFSGYYVLQIGEEGLSAGKEIDVSVDMIVPQQPGRVVSHWRLAAPGGLQFGQRVWAMVQVRRGILMWM